MPLYSQEARPTQVTGDQTTRFIGDLNPEVELLSAASADRHKQNGVGVWDPDDSGQRTPATETDLFTSASIFHNCSEAARTAILPVLLQQSVEVLPPPDHMRVLEHYYVEHVHPILPAVDLEAVTTGASSVFQQQIMCLLVCPAPQLQSHLLLKHSDDRLHVADFSAKVLAAMRMVVELGLVQDKTILIRGLTVMSITSNGRHNYEFSAQFFARAVHLSYTIGLHQPRDHKRDEKVNNLFCLVWSIDKMHAATHGRPVLMHEVDMGKAIATCSQSQVPGFRTLVYISILLERVIGLYRPGAYTYEIPDSEFPSFDEILLECNATQLPTDMLATLELYYHSVGVLSCRRGARIAHEGGPTPEQHTEVTTRNTRQSSSAMHILAIMDQQNTTGLVVIHLVPYAVSLALSAACRDLRLSNVATQRQRAISRFESLCQRHLRPLGEVFWSARVMAEMAAKILNDMQVPHITTTSRPAPDVGDNSHDTEPETSLFSDNLGDFMNPDLDLGDIEGFLESNLDPSMPSLFRDIDFSFGQR